MNKLTKIKTLAFSGIIVVGTVSYVYHLLPYRAVWLWFPILVFVDYWLSWYARRRGMILSDELTEQATERSAWATFQATIAFIFLAIVYYDINRTLVDSRIIFAYVAGFMGVAFIVFKIYYNFEQGIWDLRS